MKKIFFGILAMAAMAACATDEPIALNQEAIQFGNAFVDNSVRGAYDPSYGATNVVNGENVTKNLTSLKVYGAVEGVNIYNGVKIQGTLGYTVWNFVDTVPTQYWIADANYVFDAVVDATSVAQDAATLLPTSLYYEAASQKDMLHQRVTCTGKINETGVVPFTFTHLLSKVKLTVENTTAASATGYRYTITDIKLTNAYATGKYAVVEQEYDSETVNAGEWFAQTSGTHTIDAMTIASNTTEECATEVLLIPGASVGITFNVNVQMLNSVTREYENITTVNKAYNNAVTLAANTAYNFKVSVGLNEEIQFTATTLDSWVPAEKTLN